MIDDHTLLRRYATERSEDAFAELVRRHLPLVYSAAVRRLGGDTHRAEDVAQVVFSTVAREAHQLVQHPMLTGWLYTTTRNAVIDVVRTEQRRRLRETEAQVMQEILSESAAPADWSRLQPVLDAAMDELRAEDREAVLLRFFQAQPFAAIGATLGLSEDAARKRVDRALDQLGEHLRRRKIASTAAALAALLASETVIAAPATLATTISAKALATGGASAGAAALFTATNLKVGLAAVIIGGGAVGLVTQQRAISRLETQAAAAQTQLTQLGAENTELVQARRAAEADSARLRAGVSPQRSSEVMADGSGVAAPAATQAILPLVSNPEALVLGALPDTPEIQRQRAQMHRRYDPFFQQRGLTAAQGERFIELKIHQARAREDFQAAIRAANLRGDSAAVQALRSKDDSPVTRGLQELLGREGYAAYAQYESSSFYRVGYVEPVLAALSSAGASLSPTQTDQLQEIFVRSARHLQARPTDIGTTLQMDWDAVVAQARGLLTPAQFSVLETHAARRKTTQGPAAR